MKTMKQSNFFKWLEHRPLWKKRLKDYADKTNDRMFYFTLGEIFDKLGIKGWDSDGFINKTLEVVGSLGW
jgi:hypothetical protein